MNRIEFLIGLGLDRNGRPIDERDAIAGLHAAENHMALLYGGCTILCGRGSWQDGDTGMIDREDSAIIVVYANADKRCHRTVAKWLVDRFNQKSVGVGVTLATIEIVESE